MPAKQPSKLNITIGRVPLVQKVAFAKHLAVMIESGIVISEALDISTESAKGTLKNILIKVTKDVRSGTTLADALGKHPKTFPSLFIDITRAGEESGTLSENLKNIANQLDKERKLISKIKGAMAYPMVILVAGFVLALGMAYYVLPQITPLFIGLKIELPWTTRAIIWISELVQNHGGPLFIGIVIAIAAFLWFIRQKFTQFITHAVVLNIPIIRTIVKNSNLARFSLTLGTLLKSGLTIDKALEITQRTVPNWYYRRLLKKVTLRIKTGTSMYSELNKKPALFPKLATSMIRVGEESGKLDESLLYLADFYEEEVDNATKTLTTAIEPALLIIIGLGVAILALSIITPIYEITGNIKK